MTTPTAESRYRAAMHAVQTGVALDHQRGSNDGTPKHLRVGVNSALVGTGALVALLVEKGLITFDEYMTALADAAEAEQARYESRLGVKLA